MAFQFDQLHTLVALVEEGTFEAAAQRLRVTASAVSQRIKGMEQAAGQVLVQRTNPVRPTPAGDVVLKFARQVRLLEGDLDQELGSAMPSTSRATLPLAVNADSLATWFLEALSALPRRVSVAFDIHREDEQHSADLLRSGAVMAAVTATPEAVQGCSVERLGVMRYRAVCSPEFVDRWLSGTAGIDRLEDAPMVNFDRKDDLQRRFVRAALGREVTAPSHYIPTSADFAQAVRLGFGWGLLPEQQCLSDLKSGRLVELAAQSPVDVPLYWQRWNLASSLLDEVTDAIRATAAARLHA